LHLRHRTSLGRMGDLGAGDGGRRSAGLTFKKNTQRKAIRSFRKRKKLNDSDQNAK